MRLAPLLLIGLVAAAPKRPPLPLPPIPPAHPPPSQIAPMPDLNLLAPRTEASGGPSVGFTMFRSPTVNTTSRGYPAGSQFRSKEDARPIQTPGLTLRVPLQ